MTHRAPHGIETPAEHSSLVDALRDRLSTARGPVALIETHISSVLLADNDAYKLKKPLDLGFLDHRSLAARRQACEEELRLNRRTAPQLYLGLCTVTGSAQQPTLEGTGEPIDYAVHMRRFDADATLDRVLTRGALTPGIVDALAATVAAFHASAPAAPAHSAFATPALVARAARDNFDHIERLDPPAAMRGALARLRGWTEAQLARLGPVFAARRDAGQVRECHGDLHLGNVALIDGAPVLFDAIEFNAGFRWIDVASEIAFTAMDLAEHDAWPLCWRFLNAYLEHTGDYGAVGALRFYMVYRAMVRAKVETIRARQQDEAARTDAFEAAHRHLVLAERLARPDPPALLLVRGRSGSGKTTLAQAILESTGGFRIRSDIERKRLAGLSTGARTASGLESGLYSAGHTRETYARLERLARDMLPAGFPVIVDATCLRRAERDAFRALARDARACFLVVSCVAPDAVLRERIETRAAHGKDASEATLEVLERQAQIEEAPDADEGAASIACDTAQPDARQRVLETIELRLAARDTAGGDA